MTITQINYFLAAEAAGSLTQAADELGVSQPTLSEQMRKLEQHLGVALFTRAKAGLTLTEAGRRFLPRARRVAVDFDDAIRSVAGIRDLTAGSVSFGVFNSAPYVLPGVIPAFRERHPQVAVRMVAANSDRIADGVRTGRLEAGLVALPVDARGLTIGDELWSCEAAYFHVDPMATAQPVTIDELTRRPLVLPDVSYADHDPSRRELSDRAQRAGHALVPDIEVDDGAAALAVAASGVAGAVVSLPAAQSLGYTERLGWVSLEPQLIETFALITGDPNSLSPGATAMIEIVREHMGRLHSRRAG